MTNEEYRITVLTDNTPFKMDAKVKLRPHFLYYGNTQLTDKKCIKNGKSFYYRCRVFHSRRGFGD